MRLQVRLAAGVFFGVILFSLWLIFGAAPSQAAGETCSNGSASPCAEDLQIQGCTNCHSIRVTGGNRNGTDRVITGSSGVNRHIDDPPIADWTSIVQSMIDKGAAAILELTSGYLNTNYCVGCAGPILGSPVQSNVTTTGATVTWSTSANGFEDEPANTLLFYGTNKTDVLNCTSTSGCAGVSVANDNTPVAHHVAALTGLACGTRYYMVDQATGTASTSGLTTRSTYAVSFRTKSCPVSSIPPLLFASEDESSSSTENDRIVVIDPNPLTPDFNVNPNYNQQVGNVAITGKDPAELTAHPDGSTVYAAVGVNLSVIDATSTPPVETTSLIGAGDLFNHMVVSPDGTKLYLVYRKSTGTATLEIKVFDTTTPSNPTLTTTISNPVFDGCYAALGLGIRPDGGQLYLACRPVDTGSQDRFYMVDTATNIPTLTAVFSRDNSNMTSINAITVKQDGSVIYLARTSSTAPVSDMEMFGGISGAEIGTIPLPTGAKPRAGVLSLDGTRLYVVDQVDGIYVIDTSSNTRLLTIPSSKSRGFDIAISPDGARLYTSLLSSVFVNDTATNSADSTILGDYSSVYNLVLSPGHGAPPTPELMMTAVTPNAASVMAGNTLSLTDTVKNLGSGATDTSFIISYALSPSPNYADPGAVILGTRVVSALNAEDSDTATTNLLIPISIAPGAYYVCALADSTGAVAEGNTDNNTLCSVAAVQVNSPDLVVSAIAPNSGAFAPGGTLSVTDTVQNIGSASTGVSSIVAYSLSTDTTYGNGDDVPLATTRSVGVLAAGASSTATRSLAIPASTPTGTYYVCAKADSSDAVAESNETNNTLCSTTTVGPATPDLIISAASTATTSVAPGKSFSLSNSAMNQGSGQAGQFIIAFHLSTNAVYGDGDDIVLTATRTVASLGAGKTSTASTSLLVPATVPLGDYYVCAMADRDNTVAESDETNNSACTAGPIHVTYSDLTMTAVTPNASTLSATATLSVTNSATNQSGVAVPVAFKVGFVLSPTVSYDDPGAIATTTTRTVTSGLAGGATSTATTTLTFSSSTPPGNYYVCAKADSTGIVTESDETNNTLCSTGTVTVPLADLIMSAVSMTATTVAPGTNITLSNTAKNQGQFPAGSFTIAYHLSTNTTYGDGDDIAITQTRTVTSLAALGTNTASTLLTVPSTTPLGSYYVCALADSNNTVPESNEANNSLCTATPTVTAGLPDLLMTVVSPNSSTANAGGTVSVNNTVANQGTASAVGFVIQFVLSINTTYGDGDDIVFSTTRPGGTVAAGASVPATTTLTLPSTVPPGSYYVCSKADWDNRIVESNETNNALCSASPITVPADLIMTVVSTSSPGAAPGGTISLSNTVKNQGTSSTNGSSTIGFHLSTNTVYGDGDDIASVTIRSVASLAANATSAATTSVVVPSTTPLGFYYVCANADDTNLIAETNETNNALCTATPIQVGPDLIVSAISTTATTVTAGSPFSVSNTVLNQGGATAGSSSVAFRLSPNTTYGDGDDIVVTATRSLSALNAGASSVASTTITVPVGTPSGSYHACGMADYLNQVAETVETNNSACTPTTITVP